MNPIFEALRFSFNMFWEVFWPLSLGFLLSAIVQAFISHKSLIIHLGDDSPKSLSLAALFGTASSSCSYAAVALARSVFKKGASFTSSIVFELASTNLVIELGVILFVLMGWQFALSEWIGGIIMVILIALIFRVTLTKKLVEEAKQHAQKGIAGKMEGHAEMDMSISGKGSFWQKLLSREGITSVSHYFVSDWYSVWTDILLGFLIAGSLAALVPQSFWQVFFLKSNPTFAFIEGPLIGPLVAIISFVCSVGNVPLAVVLWQGGISFGGVVSFIFADLIVLPILDIYRKYYGWKVMFYLLLTFYVTMALAGYIVEIIFGILGIIPTDRNLAIISEGVHLNYTSILNIIFLAASALLVLVFIKTGGIGMLKMMNSPKEH